MATVQRTPIDGHSAGIGTDHTFYNVMAVVLALLIVAGFAPTFYARGLLFDLPPLSATVHAHGTVFTVWVVLSVVQPVLIAVHRPRWHRWLGYGLAAAATAMVALGGAAIAGLERTHAGEPGRVLAVHLFTNVAPLLEFGGFVAAGVWFRGTAAVHKRCMLLATVVLLPAATGRLFGYLDIASWNSPVYAAFAFANALYDWRTRGRPHPVALWGAALMVAVDLAATGLLDLV